MTLSLTTELTDYLKQLHGKVQVFLIKQCRQQRDGFMQVGFYFDGAPGGQAQSKLPFANFFNNLLRIGSHGYGGCGSGVLRVG